MPCWLAAAAVAEKLWELGYSTLWMAGGQGNNLAQIGNVIRATSRIGVASGILSVDRVPAAEVIAAYTALARTQPGRFVVGLGGAHGAKPLAALNAYLRKYARVRVGDAQVGDAILTLSTCQRLGDVDRLVVMARMPAEKRLLTGP